MLTLLSLVTAVKDYIEIAHKLVETSSLGIQSYPGSSNLPFGNGTGFGINDYTEFGAILTYVVLSIKDFLTQLFTFSWLNNAWSLPLIVPDVASAMISEISVLDNLVKGSNSFSFLDKAVGFTTADQTSSITNTLATTGGANPLLFGFEKFMIGFFNSFFLFLPTSTAHLITLRRFVMQGVEAGVVAGLGTIAGNFLWLSSIILGLRFIVIPWLSLDIFRYLLGFMLLVKYLWDSSPGKEAKAEGFTSLGTLADNAKMKIFLLNFLLTFTEQTSIFPFISNMSFGADGSIIEGLSGIQDPTNFLQFFGIHFSYLLGILLGSFSLLFFTVWFWENPAYNIYMWMISTSRVSTSSYYKVLNFIFLYLTMLCAITSIPYFGLDYTITNPLGFIPQDRILSTTPSGGAPGGAPILQETAFLNVKPTDKNTRIRDGVHARRERWKDRLLKYQAFDASVYDQGVYDILTVEDLNYGFDRFWLRRKMRNHQIRFRLFPGPWMRSVKKQLNKPGLSGPRMEFFRILFEQYYHPSFHTTVANNSAKAKSTLVQGKNNKEGNNFLSPSQQQFQNLAQPISKYAIGAAGGGVSSELGKVPLNLLRDGFLGSTRGVGKKGLIAEYSALRKFSRNFSTRFNSALNNNNKFSKLSYYNSSKMPGSSNAVIYSKSLKSLYNKIYSEPGNRNVNILRNISKNLLIAAPAGNNKYLSYVGKSSQKLPFWSNNSRLPNIENNRNKGLKKTSIAYPFKHDRNLLIAKTALESTELPLVSSNIVSPLGAQRLPFKSSEEPLWTASAISPLRGNEAFKRKLQYYSTAATRTFSVGNNAPYFKTMMKRAFYYHKPSLRYKRTMFAAAMRRGFRKKSVAPRKLRYAANSFVKPEILPKGNVITANTDREVSPVGALVQKSTQQYSVLGKRASRYRYQIYKDVLQHWYYSPFNRLLLKFDVDSFMNRQPKSQFLTQKEERLLHMRRLLLSEHYNTLRWYTYMQHYRTMKSRIGGTKSFASTVYNQQFQGTFKKIRHLFAITPIQSWGVNSLGTNNTQSISTPQLLRFDQPLYNEYSSQSLGSVSPYLHESLGRGGSSTPVAKGSLTKSAALAGLILSSQQPNNVSTISNMPDLYSKSPQSQSPIEFSGAQADKVLLELLKQCKNRLNDQTFLKNYITHRIDKREQRNKQAASELKSQLENLKNWLTPLNIGENQSFNSGGVKGEAKFQASTGIRKALKDAILAKALNKPSVQVSYVDTHTSRKAVELSVESIESVKALIPLQEKKKVAQKIIEKAKKATLIFKPFFILQAKLFSKRTEKNLEWWRQKQQALYKRKSSRKSHNFQTDLAKKVAQSGSYQMPYNKMNYLRWLRSSENREVSTDFVPQGLMQQSNFGATPSQSTLRKKTAATDQNPSGSFEPSNQSTQKSTLWSKLFLRKFIKKPSRRYKNTSVSRGFAYVRKPKNINSFNTVSDYIQSLNNTFNPALTTKFSVDYKGQDSTGLFSKEEKMSFLKDFKAKLAKKITISPSASSNSLKDLLISYTKNPITQTSIKSSPSKSRSRHKWRKLKRQKFSKDLNKYRKRSLHGSGKLRALAKKLKRIQATQEFQSWWWNQYLPNMAQKINANCNSGSCFSSPSTQQPLLRSQDKFKPLRGLSINEALDIKSNSKALPPMENGIMLPNVVAPLKDLQELGAFKSTTTVPNSDLDAFKENNSVYSIVTMPFYAGWDESLRKFVVTNRLLSRRDAGFIGEINLNGPNLKQSENNYLPGSTQNTVNTLEFTKAPIKGLNEGLFLYLQTDMPFNSYNLDQFLPNNQSFYAPLGWKRFQFRHSQLKTWLTKSVKALKTANSEVLILRSSPENSLWETKVKNSKTNKTSALVNRRIKKRYKLLRQTPMQLMYVPTGALLMETLPSHYISVFDKQYRFPRNRYLKRNLPKANLSSPLKELTIGDYTKANSNSTPKDFTLRKRVKPRRKYHKKRFVSTKGLVFPRRRKFGTLQSTSDPSTLGDFRLRPSTKVSSAISTVSSKNQKRSLKATPTRVRALHRREFQQVVKPLQRFQPRYGGFTWPGDYLRLDVFPLPKLEVKPDLASSIASKTAGPAQPIAMKRKIGAQPVGLLPRTYLLKKHNLKVMKKKLALRNLL